MKTVLKSFLVALVLSILAAMIATFIVTMLGCVTGPQVKTVYGYAQYRGDHCELCHSQEQVEWAHAYPQSLSRGTSLDYLINSPTNGISLCRKCHVILSHYGNTSRYWNPELLPMVERLKQVRKEYK